jgi:fumarylacetoacetase
MLKTLRNPTRQLRSKNFQLSIYIRNIRTYTMAPLKSWLSIPTDSHFSLANIPFGIITSKNSQVEKRPAVAIGDHVLDLKAFAAGNGFAGLPSLKDHFPVFAQPSLNAFAALGQPIHREVRKYLQDVFSESTSHPQILKDNAALQKAALLPKHETKTHLPMQIGDYTDFFAGINHAFNVGTMFRVPLSSPHLPSFLSTLTPLRAQQTPSNPTTPTSQSVTTAAPPPS